VAPTAALEWRRTRSRDPMKRALDTTLALGLSVLAALASGCLCPGGQLLCGGECVDVAANDAANCGACGRACTALESCERGACVRLPTCGPTAPRPMECEDGNPCNGIQECVAGQCQLTRPALSCADGQFCTLDSCDPGTGECRQQPDDAMCGAEMICDPSAGCITPCPYAPCSVAAQCGCGTGQTCAPSIGGTVACTPASFDTLGSSCTQTRECAVGLICLSLGAVDEARCSEPCADDDDCDGICFRSLGEELALSTGERVGRCEQVCDPVDSSGCARSQRCEMVFGTDGGEGTFCREAGTGVAGTPCTERAECARGHTCVRYPSSTLCGRLCHDDGDCPSSQDCGDFITPIVLRGRRIGSCS